MAGSEKFNISPDLSQTEKELRLLELRSINGSLSKLGHCISVYFTLDRLSLFNQELTFQFEIRSSPEFSANHYLEQVESDSLSAFLHPFQACTLHNILGCRLLQLYCLQIESKKPSFRDQLLPTQKKKDL